MSDDGGTAWRPFGGGVPPYSGPNFVVADPFSPGGFYLGVSYGGLYARASTDGAWRPLGLTGSSHSIDFDEGIPGVLLVGSDNGIERSTDGGSTFSNVGPATSVFQSIEDSSGALYARTYNDVERSTDGGSSWTSLFGTFGLDFIALDPISRSTLYAAFGTSGVFTSNDGGATWTPMGLSGIRLSGVAFDRSTPGVVLAAGLDGLFRSIDGGTTWIALAPGMEAPSIASMAADATGSQLYAASVSDYRFQTPPPPLSRSTDAGAHWSVVVGVTDSIGAVAMDPTSPSVVYAGTNGTGPTFAVLKSTDSGSTWQRSTAGLPASPLSALAVDPAIPQTVFAGTNGAGVVRSTDGGATWGATGLTANGVSVSEVVVDPAAPVTVFAATADGVFKSTDGGATWAAGAGLFAAVRALAISPTNDLLLLAGSPGGLAGSTDGGSSWTMNPAFSSSMTAVGWDPVDPQTYYAATADSYGFGFRRTTDGGATWTAMETGLAGVPGGGLAVRSGHLDLATDKGVFDYDATRNPGPALTGISPAVGAGSGGTTIQLTGDGFLPGATVSLGGMPATSVLVQSPQSIVASTPSSSPGFVDVVVTNPDGATDVLSDGFRFLAPAPQLTSIAPTTGSTSGGTDVILTGVFASAGGVTFGGGSAVSLRWLDANHVVATTPPFSPYPGTNPVDVTIADEDGQTATLPAAYTYAPVALRFHTISPCRMIDTRRPVGEFGGPPLQGDGAQRSFYLSWTCGIGGNPAALAVNLTVVNPSAAGDLRIFPGPQGQASAASVINFGAGRTRANNAVVDLEAGTGEFTVQTDIPGGSTNFLLDVVGYFE